MSQRPASEADVALTRYPTLCPQRGQRVSFVEAQHALRGHGLIGAHGERRGSPAPYTSAPHTRRVCAFGMRFALLYGSDRGPTRYADVSGTPSVVAIVLRGVVC